MNTNLHSSVKSAWKAPPVHRQAVPAQTMSHVALTASTAVPRLKPVSAAPSRSEITALRARLAEPGSRGSIAQPDDAPSCPLPDTARCVATATILPACDKQPAFIRTASLSPGDDP